MTTDFGIRDKERAFLNLLKERKRKKNITNIYDNVVTVLQNKINECMYCNKSIKSPKVSGMINMSIRFGRFCSELCRDIYYNMYKDIFLFSSSVHSVNMLPYSLILNKDEYDNFIKGINYKEIVNITTLYSIDNCILSIKTKNDIYTMHIKYLTHSKRCLYCGGITDSAYMLKTNYFNIYGFCSFICMTSLNKLLHNTIGYMKYSIFIPILEKNIYKDSVINTNKNNIDIDNIFAIVDGVDITNDIIRYNIKIFTN